VLRSDYASTLGDKLKLIVKPSCLYLTFMFLLFTVQAFSSVLAPNFGIYFTQQNMLE
jgi:hypothetical protein